MPYPGRANAQRFVRVRARFGDGSPTGPLSNRVGWMTCPAAAQAVPGPPSWTTSADVPTHQRSVSSCRPGWRAPRLQRSARRAGPPAPPSSVERAFLDRLASWGLLRSNQLESAATALLAADPITPAAQRLLVALAQGWLGVQLGRHVLVQGSALRLVGDAVAGVDVEPFL